MTQQFPLYLIILLPLLGAVVNLVFGRRLGNGLVSLIACGAVVGAALVATLGVWTLHDGGGRVTLVDQLLAGDFLIAGDFKLSAGLMLDALSSVLVLIVTWIALLIHIYSTGYMEHEPDYARFFGYLNLFTAAMLILVLGDSLPITFIGWEGVGLASYLLIGFWYSEDKNANAGRKAFIVNRIGDFGFLLGICVLFTVIGTLKYSELSSHILELRAPYWMGWPAAYWAAALLFIGCMGKSAQIPLYVWLPDAMAGPTPVSALIHAATMVTAGVYLVARTHVLFDMQPHAARMLVAGIGALTALFAATIGIVQRDFKKVLAYSTVSQLGFMFVGVGTGAYTAGIFHLTTHAFFKAGLFLGAGSVMHAMGGEGDVLKMGGLGKHLPITRWTFFIYCLAISGIFPFAGFFSKDAILAGAFASHFQMAENMPEFAKAFVHAFPYILWGMLALAALCTAFYMWRLYFMVFTGTFRGTIEQEHHLHESPSEMTIPLIILAIGSVAIGFLGVPAIMTHGLPETAGQVLDFFPQWLANASIRTVEDQPLSHGVEWGLMGLALTLSAVGIGLAARLYRGGISDTAIGLERRLSGLHKVLFNKYYVDELYDLVIVRPTKILSRILWRFADATVIDGGLTKLGPAIIGGFGTITRRLQNGDVQRYIIAVVAGTAAILFIGTYWLPLRGVQGTVTIDKRKVTLNLGGGKVPAGRLLYRIDWDGDGKWDENSRFNSIPHDYTSAGDYTIRIEAQDQQWGVAESNTLRAKVE